MLTRGANYSMPVQKRWCLFAACVLPFCLSVTPAPAFAVAITVTPDRVTQDDTITLPPAKAVFGFSGNSFLHPVHNEENEIIPVDP